MIHRMLVIVPTRGRPGNVARLEESRRATASTEFTDFLYAVDEDDPELRNYLALGVENGADFIVDRRRRLGPTLNRVARTFAVVPGTTGVPVYSYLGFMGDDHVPRTPEWDRHVREALGTQQPRIVYGNDLIQGQRLPTAAFMHTRMVGAMGFMSPPDQIHLYIDDFWLELGQRLNGLVYLPDTIIEHVHPVGGRTAWDAGYAEANSTERTQQDMQSWVRFRADPGPDGFEAAADRIEREYRR